MYGADRPFLVPVGDTLNFGEMEITTEFDGARHAFVMRAEQAVKAGAELTWRYNLNLCVEEAVDIYGFTPVGSTECKPKGDHYFSRRISKSRPPDSEDGSGSGMGAAAFGLVVLTFFLCCVLLMARALQHEL